MFMVWKAIMKHRYGYRLSQLSVFEKIKIPPQREAIISKFIGNSLNVAKGVKDLY